MGCHLQQQSSSDGTPVGASKQRQKISYLFLRKGRNEGNPATKRKSSVSSPVMSFGNSRFPFTKRATSSLPGPSSNRLPDAILFQMYSCSILCCDISRLVLVHLVVKAGICFLITHLVTSFFLFVLFFFFLHLTWYTMGAILALLILAGFSPGFFCVHFSAYN